MTLPIRSSSRNQKDPMTQHLPSPRPARRLVVAAVLGIGALIAAGPSFGQAYPAKPITFVVPFAAGSATDQLARALGQSITEQTKQAVVVDDKPGANGFLAAQHVAKAHA